MVAAVAVALFETGDLILPALCVAAVSLITAVFFVRKTKSESLVSAVFLAHRFVIQWAVCGLQSNVPATAVQANCVAIPAIPECR